MARHLRLRISSSISDRCELPDPSSSALSSKGGSRLRINLPNLEGFSRKNGKLMGLLAMKGNMRRLQRSPNTNPTVWRSWGGHFSGYICHYIVDGWGERCGENYGGLPRFVTCKTCKKKCKTEIAPSDFYLAPGLSSVEGDARVGSPDGDFLRIATRLNADRKRFWTA